MSKFVAFIQRGWTKPGATTGAVVVEAAGESTAPFPLPSEPIGPEVITRLASRAIARTVPADGHDAHPINVFPMVEFTDATVPWLVSGEDGVPWLGLLILTEDEARAIVPGRPNASVVPPAGALAGSPDWAAWAHVQVDEDGGEVSRILGSRVLVQGTRYVAAVVPLLEAARKAGLGDAQDGSEGLSAIEAGQPLPIYFSWHFTAGPAGDLDRAVSKLAPHDEPHLGWRRLDASEGGLGLPSGGTAWMPGALVTGEEPPPDPEVADATFEEALEAVVGARGLGGFGRPELGLPLRGETLDDGALDQRPWKRSLNLEPRYRAAAALGEDVVRDRQEQLVGEALAALKPRRRGRDAGKLALAKQRVARQIARANSVHPAWSSMLATANGLDAGLGSATAHANLPERTLQSGARRTVRKGHALARQLERRAGLAQPVKATVSLESVADQLSAPTHWLGTKTLDGQVVRAPAPPPGTTRAPGLGSWGRKVLASGRTTAQVRFAARWADTDAGAAATQQPLFDALWQRDPASLIPQLDRVLDDRVALLLPHDAFVEAALIGASEELHRELLWRQVPHTERLLFRRFWRSETDDLTEDDDFTTSVLGARVATRRPSTWLLVRGALIREIPDVRIALHSAIVDGEGFRADPAGGYVLPAIELQLDARTLLVGFDVALSEPALQAKPFVVFYEPEVGARFGIEEAESLPDAVPDVPTHHATSVSPQQHARDHQLPASEVWVHLTRLFPEL